MLRVTVGVFAHNEAAGIAAMVAALSGQDIIRAPGLAVRIVILANGCTDATVAVARQAIAATTAPVEVVDLAQGGKSRTWNRFVHEIAGADADVLVFADADIEMPEPDTLSRLVRALVDRPGLWVANSRPVKDIAFRPEGLRPLDRLIAAAGGGLDDWRTAICGQLYAMPAPRARQFHLPVGLPVEDGFLRAMVLTDTLTVAEDFSRIDGAARHGEADLFHVYASERSIPALIRHQIRIVIGSAINAACFAYLRRLPEASRAPELARASGQDDWLPAVIRAELPRWPQGYVPVHFLTKRLVRLWQGRAPMRRLPVAIIGFFFDLIVYVAAQIRMARGAGSGFW